MPARAMNQEAKVILEQMPRLSSPAQATHAARFFKTKPGQYGEGDQFLGINVPTIRTVAKQHRQSSLSCLQELLENPWHEIRLLALFIATEQYQKQPELRTMLVEWYLGNTQFINNWDLVDCSTPHMLGNYLCNRQSWSILERLTRSTNLWERRIAIVATLAFIRHQQFEPTLTIAKLLMNDTHDLIHKATGWMLREVGKRNEAVLQNFLSTHGNKLPRTALRYAIERFPIAVRKHYLETTKSE